jgi:hypothetical protein
MFTVIALLFGHGLFAGCSDADSPFAAEEQARLSPGAASFSKGGSKGQTLTVTPQVDTLHAIGETLQLSAWATNPAGKTQQVTAVWTSRDTTVATVNRDGVVTAHGDGTVRIVGLARGRTAAAEVSVQLAGEATAASVDLSPSEVSLRVGETVSVHASVKDQFGNVMSDVPVTWSSTDAAAATVDSDGKVTARARGTAKIRAGVKGRTGSAQVQITQASTPPPPETGGGGAWPNQPSGFTLITDQPWDELPSHPSNPWSWNENSRAAIVADASAPTPGSRVFRAMVRKGTDGSGTHNTWYSFPGKHHHGEIYFAAWYKFPTDWQNHLVGTKQLWPAYDGVHNQFYTGFSSREMKPRVHLQGQTWGNRNLIVNMGPASHRDLTRWRDQWVRLEYYIKMNTVNQLGKNKSVADGIVRVWMTAGGQTHQIMNHEDVKFLSVDAQGNHWSPSFERRSSGKFNGIKWNPTYGGMGDPAPRDMFNYTAHIYVSGR